MSYPSTPGSKTSGPSETSAKRMAGVSELLRMRCLTKLKDRPLTADECAELLGETPFSIRPRFTEMKARGQIVATGERRQNLSGHAATVWKLVNLPKQ